jgi:two-component system, OmpR family, copper resistance phosphate regulon response regulator CusR
MARLGAFDLPIVDLELPGPALLAGRGVLRQLRRDRSTLPVLLLGGGGGLEAAAAALEEGADDYLTRPFQAAELLARVRLRLRRVRHPAPGVLRHGDLLVDLRTRQAWTPLGSVELTDREVRVLEALAGEPGQVVSRQRLLRWVWATTSIPAPTWWRSTSAACAASSAPDG